MNLTPNFEAVVTLVTTTLARDGRVVQRRPEVTLGRVVCLSEARYAGRLAATSARGEISSRDRAVLDAWSRDGRRATACYDEFGTYMMLYEAECCWASWGIVWRKGNVLLWDCVTHEDIGTFPSAAAALVAIGSGSTADMENVVPFCPPRAERQLRL